MMKLALSPAAAGLLRALVARAGINRDRILLTDFRSIDWQSLTFVGERHEMELRIPPVLAYRTRVREPGWRRWPTIEPDAETETGDTKT